MASTPGIEIRHTRDCPALVGGSCRCEPSFRAWVYSPRDKRKIRKTCSTRAAAKAWRADALGAVRRGTLRTPTQTTLVEAAGAWLGGAASGMIRLRNGQRYKPSTLRGYEQALRLRILPELG